MTDNEATEAGLNVLADLAAKDKATVKQQDLILWTASLDDEQTAGLIGALNRLMLEPGADYWETLDQIACHHLY